MLIEDHKRNLINSEKIFNFAKSGAVEGFQQICCEPIMAVVTTKMWVFVEILCGI